MAKSILEALYHGEINPLERNVFFSRERKGVEKKIESEKQYFMEKMSLDDCKRFQEFEGLLTEAALDEELEIFSYSFSIGALLILDVLKKREEIIN